MEDQNYFVNLMDFVIKPATIETLVDIFLCTVPICLAVMIGWAWRPRWTGLVVLGFRSKLRGFAWTAPPGFGARRLWLAFTALSAFSVGRRMWSNFREKERKDDHSSPRAVVGRESVPAGQYVDGSGVDINSHCHKHPHIHPYFFGDGKRPVHVLGRIVQDSLPGLAFQVLDHIIPSEGSSSSKPAATNKDKAVDTDLWPRLDAIVLQWIYGTISNDLLHTILKPNSTAAQAWQSLANIFQDNKTSRALYLENKFSNTKVDSFPTISAYCQELKVLSDQLANVDAPISNQRLVLQLIAGLNGKFDGVAMLLQQTTPLPDFYEARSRLIPEETRQAHQNPADAALHAAVSRPQNSQPPPNSGSRGSDFSHGTEGRWPSDSGPRGRGRGGRTRGRGRSHGRGQSYSPQPWMSNYQQWNWSPQAWTAPPVPYPTTPAPRGQPRHGKPDGILGPAPSQFYSAVEPGPAATYYTPTNIEQALHTMTLNPDQNWYMDTGATNHMSNTTGAAL